jgi:hypothetical protein
MTSLSTWLPAQCGRRLEDAQVALELLTTPDRGWPSACTAIEQVNQERKGLQIESPRR